MNKLNHNLQSYGKIAFILLISLKACTVGMKIVAVEDKYSKAMSEAKTIFEETSPEDFLSTLDDGNTENSFVYAEKLEKLQKQCVEEIEEIALLSVATDRDFERKGLDYSILEILDDSLYKTQFTASRDDCRDIYISMMENY